MYCELIIQINQNCFGYATPLAIASHAIHAVNKIFLLRKLNRSCWYEQLMQLMSKINTNKPVLQIDMFYMQTYTKNVDQQWLDPLPPSPFEIIKAKYFVWLYDTWSLEVKGKFKNNINICGIFHWGFFDFLKCLQ